MILPFLLLVSKFDGALALHINYKFNYRKFEAASVALTVTPPVWLTEKWKSLVHIIGWPNHDYLSKYIEQVWIEKEKLKANSDNKIFLGVMTQQPIDRVMWTIVDVFRERYANQWEHFVDTELNLDQSISEIFENYKNQDHIHKEMYDKWGDFDTIFGPNRQLRDQWRQASVEQRAKLPFCTSLWYNHSSKLDEAFDALDTRYTDQEDQARRRTVTREMLQFEHTHLSSLSLDLLDSTDAESALGFLSFLTKSGAAEGGYTARNLPQNMKDVLEKLSRLELQIKKETSEGLTTPIEVPPQLPLPPKPSRPPQGSGLGGPPKSSPEPPSELGVPPAPPTISDPNDLSLRFEDFAFHIAEELNQILASYFNMSNDRFPRNLVLMYMNKNKGDEEPKSKASQVSFLARPYGVPYYYYHNVDGIAWDDENENTYLQRLKTLQSIDDKDRPTKPDPDTDPDGLNPNGTKQLRVLNRDIALGRVEVQEVLLDTTGNGTFEDIIAFFKDFAKEDRCKQRDSASMPRGLPNFVFRQTHVFYCEAYIQYKKKDEKVWKTGRLSFYTGNILTIPDKGTENYTEVTLTTLALYKTFDSNPNPDSHDPLILEVVLEKHEYFDAEAMEKTTTEKIVPKVNYGAGWLFREVPTKEMLSLLDLEVRAVMNKLLNTTR